MGQFSMDDTSKIPPPAFGESGQMPGYESQKVSKPQSKLTVRLLSLSRQSYCLPLGTFDEGAGRAKSGAHTKIRRKGVLVCKGQAYIGVIVDLSPVTQAQHPT